MVPLDFLGTGRYRAETYRDDLEASSRMAVQEVVVRTGETLPALLAPAGGVLIHLSLEAAGARQ